MLDKTLRIRLSTEAGRMAWKIAAAQGHNNPKAAVEALLLAQGSQYIEQLKIEQLKTEQSEHSTQPQAAEGRASEPQASESQACQPPIPKSRPKLKSA